MLLLGSDIGFPYQGRINISIYLNRNGAISADRNQVGDRGAPPELCRFRSYARLGDGDGVLILEIGRRITFRNSLNVGPRRASAIYAPGFRYRISGQWGRNTPFI